MKKFVSMKISYQRFWDNQTSDISSWWWKQILNSAKNTNLFKQSTYWVEGAESCWFSSPLHLTALDRLSLLLCCPTQMHRCENVRFSLPGVKKGVRWWWRSRANTVTSVDPPPSEIPRLDEVFVEDATLAHWRTSITSSRDTYILLLDIGFEMLRAHCVTPSSQTTE